VRRPSAVETIAKPLSLFSALMVCVLFPLLPAFAQQSIPAGTILPIRLNNSLSFRKSKPGQRFTGRIMQDVPLGNGTKIRDGAKVIGYIVAVSPATNAADGQIAFEFDSIEIGHTIQPIRTNLRALASPIDVDDAQLPLYGGDRGTPSTAYTTTQIGGEVVYRGGGHVVRDETIVGEPVQNGVLAQVRAPEGTRCRGEMGEVNGPQALWLFSTDACGLYGYPRAFIRHAGRTDPVGQILISSNDPGLNIRAGSGMLLRVDSR
jgi:hypothetical protein